MAPPPSRLSRGPAVASVFGMARSRAAHAHLLWVTAAVALGCARAPAIPVPAEPSSRIAGNVREVAPDAGRLIIDDAGRLRTVEVTPETIVRRGRTESSVAELRPGDRVVVSIAAEPPYAARLIAIAGPSKQTPRPFGALLP